MKARKSPKASEPTLRERVVQLEEDANSESPGPTGIVAQSLDGRLFFSPDTQAATLEIQPGKLYDLYRFARQQPTTTQSLETVCARTKKWLDSRARRAPTATSRSI